MGRSTQMAEDTIWFPRKDEVSPRKIIYKNECPGELDIFETCLAEHGGSLSECAAQNNALEACGNNAFKMINAMSVPYNYASGLKH